MRPAVLRSLSHWGAFIGDVRDGTLVGVRPFERDPDPSELILGIPDATYATTRVRHPYVRRGWLDQRAGRTAIAARGADSFVRVSWPVCLDLVAGELRRVRDEHGNSAIFGGSYGWASAGRFHHARTQLHRFLYAFGGCVGQVTNYSYGAAMVLLPHVLGSLDAVSGRVTDWRSIIRHTRLFVCFGGTNPKNRHITAGGAGEHGFVPSLREAQQAGIEFVNISPCRNDAPEFLNAEWIPIRPNTDAALMLGLAHTLVIEDLHDLVFLDRYCHGFERFLPYLTGEQDGQPKDAAWAAKITDVDPEVIRRLARRMASTRTMLTAAWSLQRADHGEQPFWMLIALAAMLGQIGLPGGGFGFGYGSINGIGNPRQSLPVPSLNPGPNPLNLAIPVARVTDLLTRPGEHLEFNGQRILLPDIKLVYWAGGNPFHHHQDLNRLVAAWQRPETIIVQEPWWTATARHADIVLPATTVVERNDVGASSRDRYIFAMHKMIEPVEESRSDFDILTDIAERLGIADVFTSGRDEMAWVRHIYDVARASSLAAGCPMPDFDAFWSQGYVETSPPSSDFVLFEDFRRDPMRKPLNTPSGRIEIWSATIERLGYRDCPPHPVWLEPEEWLGASERLRSHPLHLITSQPANRLHAQMDDGSQSRRTKVASREPLYIHPDTAAVRNIVNGDVVRIFNDRGSCLGGAVLTADIRPDVIQMATGAWFDPLEPGRPGSLEKHGNPNVLTRDAGTSRLGQGPSPLSTLVQVERYEEAAPPVTAFSSPALTSVDFHGSP